MPTTRASRTCGASPHQTRAPDRRVGDTVRTLQATSLIVARDCTGPGSHAIAPAKRRFDPLLPFSIPRGLSAAGDDTFVPGCLVGATARAPLRRTGICRRRVGLRWSPRAEGAALGRWEEHESTRFGTSNGSIFRARCAGLAGAPQGVPQEPERGRGSGTPVNQYSAVSPRTPPERACTGTTTGVLSRARGARGTGDSTGRCCRARTVT